MLANYSLRVKFSKQRQEMTRHVVNSLQDKSSIVRRYAIALLTKLITTHPFALLHGGPLVLTEWEGRYEVTVRELKELERKMGLGVTPGPEGEDGAGEGQSRAGEDETQAEGEEDDDAGGDEEEDEENEADRDDSIMDEGEDGDPERTPRPKRKKPKKKSAARATLPNNLANISDEQVLQAFDGQQHVKLKLVKKYVADALAFIRQIEGASEILSQLLVSTSKAEVLESMEFFKTAHEYEMECAEVG